MPSKKKTSRWAQISAGADSQPGSIKNCRHHAGYSALAVRPGYRKQRLGAFLDEQVDVTEHLHALLLGLLNQGRFQR